MSTTSLPPLLRALRPRQWSKNLLVVAAPLAGGVLDRRAVVLDVTTAFVAFCLCASAIYLVNDVMDREADRAHPRKRTRPVAAGSLSPSTAIAVSALLLLLGGLLSLTVSVPLLLTMVVYVVVQLAYSLWLKHQPVLDLALVSSGFLLRAIAGGVAAEVVLSQWFLLVAAFGSLFIVAGKRYSELHTVGAEARTRQSLVQYSESYLRFVWGLAASVTVTTYSLWAFEISSTGDINWQAISIAPFVLAMLRYGVDVDRGLTGEPEVAVMQDRVLLVLALLWLAIFTTGVHLG